jgi:hypothetical protein
MTRETAFTLTVAACLLHGLVSPMLMIVAFFHPVWLPEMLPVTPEVVFYGSSLIVATGTLLLSAVPAALAERLGLLSPDGALTLWLAGAAALTGFGILARFG